MIKLIRKITLILTVLILSGSLFFQLNLPVYAEEDPSIIEETSTEEIAGAEHSSFGNEMLAAAKDRYGFNRRALLRSADPDTPSHSNRILEYASMPYIGNAYIVAFHVDFPDRQFEEGDTEEALQKAIGVDLEGNQYESFYNDQYANVNGYYQRASYGKLAVSGNTFSYTAKKPGTNTQKAPSCSRRFWMLLTIPWISASTTPIWMTGSTASTFTSHMMQTMNGVRPGGQTALRCSMPIYGTTTFWQHPASSSAGS